MIAGVNPALAADAALVHATFLGLDPTFVSPGATVSTRAED
jgi:hypothetical protein